MPTYEFKCEEHGMFDLSLSFGEYDQLARTETKDALAPCATPGCEELAPRVLQLFGNISTSDDPSFGSQRGEKRNREYQGFDPDKHGWEERPKHSKADWEYA